MTTDEVNEFSKKISEELMLRQVWKDGIWLQQQVISGRISATELHYIQLQAQLIQEVYSNNWSFYISTHIYNYRKNHFDKKAISIKFKFKPIIHFENIIIKNTIGHELKIRSIFVRLESFCSTENNKYVISSMYGTRDIITYNEYNNSYVHSHLTSCTYSINKIEYTSFCLGNGEINFMFTLLSQKFDNNLFKTILFHLKGYLEWESLEGVPYKRIEDLHRISNNNNLPYLDIMKVNNATNLILKIRKEEINQNNKVVYNLKWKLEGNKLVLIDDINLEQYCLLNQNRSFYSSEQIVFKDSTGTYFPITAVQSNITVIPDNYIIFGGEKRYLKIEGLLDTSQREFYIHPQIKKHVKSRLEYAANQNYQRTYLTKRLQDKSNYAVTLYV